MLEERKRNGSPTGETDCSPEKITHSQAFELALRISRALEAKGINYFISGSLAYKLLTADPDSGIGDVDIIVSQANFERIIQIFSDSTFYLNPVQTPYAVHGRHRFLMGDDGKPFNFAFDSYEHYYSGKGLNLEVSDFQDYPIGGEHIRLVNKDALRKVYELGLQGNNISKFPVWRDKIARLNSL